MGIFDIFKRNKGQKPEIDSAWLGESKAFAGPSGPGTQLFTGGTAASRSDMGLVRAYREVPAFYSVVSKVAENAASTPFKLFAPIKQPGQKHRPRLKRLQSMAKTFRKKELSVRLNKREVEEIEVHPFYDLMCNPNPNMTGRIFFYLLYSALDVVGEAFAIIERDRKGMPVGLWYIPAHWVIEFPRADRESYRISWGGSVLEVTENNLLWFRKPDLESPYSRGTAAGRAVADDLDIDENAATYINNFFHNRGLPDMLVSVPDADDDQLQQARAKWESENLGFNRAYRTAWISGEVSVERLDTTFNDSQLIELRRYTRDMIYQTFGISPEMLGVLEDSNRATISEARYLFSENVLTPRIDLVCEVLQQKLIPEYDERLILSFDEPVPDDNEFKFKVMKQFPHTVTVNEIRALQSLPDRPDGEVLAIFDEPIIVETFDEYEVPDDVQNTDGVQEEPDTRLQLVENGLTGTLP